MTSKEKQAEMDAFQIEELLECVYTAICGRCGAQKDDNTTESDFARKLQSEGWRVSDDDELICPKCAK